MNTETTEHKVRLLVENLATSWNGGSGILRKLQAAQPDASSPFDAFAELNERGKLQSIFSDDEGAALDVAVRGLTDYLTTKTWFDREVKTDPAIYALRSNPIAYFCSEFGFENWLPIYSGGLGILAGDMVKEASDMGVPFVGIGLFYRHGFFNQALDETGFQHEVYPTLDPSELPLTRVEGEDNSPLLVAVPVADRTIQVAVWRVQIGRVTLYLLDTDTPENLEADRAITANLYGGDNETRIQQELVLGIGGVRALRALGIEPSVFSMNEGHAAFLGLELMLESLPQLGFAGALEATRNRIVYTNHTVVPAGNDVFSTDLVSRYLGPYVRSRGVTLDQLLPMAGDTGFSMAVFAFRLSGKANAVSHIHADAIRAEPSWSQFSVEAVTNGVHVPTWLGPEMEVLLTKYVGDLRADAPDWEAVYRIPSSELWQARNGQRARLIERVRGLSPDSHLEHNSLTMVWARRFAQYKRAGLLARDIERLAAIMSNQERPVQLIISGKAHPRDEGGKRMMQELLYQLRSNQGTGPQFAFVEDYNIDVAHDLVQGADIWINTPRKPLEASGTSGMKASDNGCLQLTVADGWAAEVDWYQVGWGLGGFDDDNDAGQLYQYLESSIVPAFYERNGEGVPEDWVSMMRRTIVLTLTRYSARRMLHEYVDKLYRPLMEAQQGEVVAT